MDRDRAIKGRSPGRGGRPSAEVPDTPSRSVHETLAPGLIGWLVEPAPGPGEAPPEVLRATMDALSAHIAILDETGRIIAVNEAWRRYAQANGLRAADHGVGTNYLEVCAAAGVAGAGEAGLVATGIRAVLGGERPEFRLEYPCPTGTEPRWFQLRVTRFRDRRAMRLVLAHEDITEPKRAEEAMHHLTGRLLRLQDDERRRIARELHDVTAQNLLAITLNIARLEELVAGRGGSGRTLEILADTLALGEQSLREIRTLSYLLHPPLLDEVGLASALRWYVAGFVERSGIAVELSVPAEIRHLPPDIATALFRIVQESLANIHRHSGSTTARIALRRRRGELALEVRDEGAGILAGRPVDTPDDIQSVGVGIAGMRARLRQLGGKLEITSNPKGTKVRATVPLASPARRARRRGAGTRG